jgi:chorismate mutase/prephenate dehydratase
VAHREQIEALRREISAVDKELVSLFIKRMRLCEQIADVKASAGIAITDTAREGKVLESAAATAIQENARDLTEEAAAFMRALIDLSKRRQAARNA